MKKILLLLLFFPIVLSAQIVQKKGYVRKISYSKSSTITPVEGVRVKVETEARSNQQGNFTLNISHNKDNSFVISDIYKDSFTLISPTINEIRVRKYDLNPNTSVEIIIGNYKEIIAEKTRIENNIRKENEAKITIYRETIANKEREIKLLRESDELYKKLLHERDSIENEYRSFSTSYYEANNKILEESDILARVDYIKLDSIEVKNIEFRKAGKGKEMVDFNKGLLPVNEARIAKFLVRDIVNSDSIIKTKEIELQKEKKQKQMKISYRDNLAKTYEDIAVGFKIDYKYDSVIVYLKKRLDLDPENYFYLIEYALVLGQQSQYSNSIKWLTIALEKALYDEQRIECHKWLGWYYIVLNDYDNAINSLSVGLKICEKNGDIYNMTIFLSHFTNLLDRYELLYNQNELKANKEYLNNIQIGKEYNVIGDKITTDKLLNYYNLLLILIKLSDLDEISKLSHIASVNFEKAKLYRKNHDFIKSKKLLEDALTVFLKLEIDNSTEFYFHLMLVYRTLGEVSSQIIDSNRLREFYFRESLRYVKLLYNNNQQAYTQSYTECLIDLANYLANNKKYNESDSCFNKTIEILEYQTKIDLNIYGPSLSEAKNSLAASLTLRGNFKTAEENYLSSLSILKKIYENGNNWIKYNFVKELSKIAYFYNYEMNDFKNSEIYYKEILNLINNEELYNHPSYRYAEIEIKNSLLDLYIKNKKNDLAKEETIDLIRIHKKFKYDTLPYYNFLFCNTLISIATTFKFENKLDSANFYYNEVIKLKENEIRNNKEFSKEEIMTSYFTIAGLYSELKQHNKAIINYSKGFKVLGKLNQSIINEHNQTIAEVYGSISYNQLFLSNFLVAERSALKGIEIDSSQTWIKTNLAHAFLFQNRYKDAEKIYLEFKDQPYPSDLAKTFKYYLLLDFDELEKAGITHPDVIKIRELLK